jgi:hypothetical protein
MSSPDKDVYYTPPTTPTSYDKKQQKMCADTIREILRIVAQLNTKTFGHEIKIYKTGKDYVLATTDPLEKYGYENGYIRIACSTREPHIVSVDSPLFTTYNNDVTWTRLTYKELISFLYDIGLKSNEDIVYKHDDYYNEYSKRFAEDSDVYDSGNKKKRSVSKKKIRNKKRSKKKSRRRSRSKRRF